MKSIIRIKMLLVAAAALPCMAFMSNSKFKSAKKDSTLLVVKGTIAQAAIKTDETPTKHELILYHYNTPVDSMVITNGKSFKFALKANTWYGIKVRSDEYVSKLISINTNLPEKKYEEMEYQLSFVIDELISDWEAKYLSADVIDFPLAIIEFDKTTEHFNYNKVYTTNIKNKLTEPLTGK